MLASPTVRTRRRCCRCHIGVTLAAVECLLRWFVLCGGMDAVPALNRTSTAATRYPVPSQCGVHQRYFFAIARRARRKKKNLAVQAPAACRPADRPPPIIAARTDPSTRNGVRIRYNDTAFGTIPQHSDSWTALLDCLSTRRCSSYQLALGRPKEAAAAVAAVPNLRGPPALQWANPAQ